MSDAKKNIIVSENSAHAEHAPILAPYFKPISLVSINILGIIIILSLLGLVILVG